MAVLLLGEDGRGYELARKLEGSGAWRAWLGDSAYATFVQSLASPSAWDSFMSSTSNIHLQLRARALLYHKASASLFLPPSSSSAASPSLSNLNPSYLQLHRDDIFFSLEEDQQDSYQMKPRPACKANDHPYERSSSFGSRHSEPENLNTSHRQRHEELPETWYSQYAEKYKMRYHKFTYGDKESLERTSEGMAAYLKLRETHKRKRQAFKEDQYTHVSDPVSENGSCMHRKIVPDVNSSNEEDQFSFFPEIMCPTNCVPDSALPLTNEMEKTQKVEVHGVLDNLPTVISRSTAMMERFGIRPEYIKVGTKYRGKDGTGVDQKPLGQGQASVMTHKVLARLLTNVGFDGGTEISIEVFAEFFSNHVCRLGRILKLLTDSYRKQFSSIELLKMFLQTAGYSNLGPLIEIIKNGDKGIIQQTQQNVRAVQSQHQNSLMQSQQLQRQMHPLPHMNMLHPQKLTFQQQQQQQQQQQWDKLRRRQASNSRGSIMITDKDQQPMVDVKTEMVESSPIDVGFNTLNKQHQLQLRLQQVQQQQQQQQQQMAMANHHASQSGQQHFRQLHSTQISQLQAQNAYNMRMPPIKVEAFHELMGGDSTMKHETDPSKLTSPSQ